MTYRPHVSNDPVTLRVAATVTTTQDAAPIAVRMKGWNQAILKFDLTLGGAATDVLIDIEGANPVGDDEPAAASTEWASVPLLDTAAGTGSAGTKTVPLRRMRIQLLATDRYMYAVPCAYKWLRIKAQATGGTATLLSVTAAQALV